MKLINQQIYSYAVKLSKLNLDDIKLPIRISFFLQKNIETIINAGQEVEAAQQKVVQTFGELNEEGTHFVVPPHKIAEAQSELNDLQNLEQDLNIHIFKLDDFDNVELTYSQLSDIMFMIEE